MIFLPHLRPNRKRRASYEQNAVAGLFRSAKRKSYFRPDRPMEGPFDADR
jgi:hypothetical protein